MRAIENLEIIAANRDDLLTTEYRQLVTRFEPVLGVSWVKMNPSSIPCFNQELLHELRAYHQSLENSMGKVELEGKSYRIQYSILASETPGVFNLGGELGLFRQLIRQGDRKSLLHYAVMCIDAMASRINHCNLPLTTISLIQGDALGGGFEAALTSDILIAERNSKMGFPEILFNLFPGMGAYSFAARKIGPAQAEKMILSGTIYSAEELHALGVVDVLVDEGEGESAVYDYIRRQTRYANGYRAVQRARQRFNPVTYQELMDITTIWVDAALQLGEKDLKVMDRFVRSQQKLFCADEQILPAMLARHVPEVTALRV
jgi:DSF synthase